MKTYYCSLCKLEFVPREEDKSNDIVFCPVCQNECDTYESIKEHFEN